MMIPTSVDKKIRSRTLGKYVERISALSGIITLVLFFIPFATSGWLPPMKPYLGAEQVAAHYRKHEAGTKAGVCLMALSSAFYAVYTAAISTQMKRIPRITHLLLSIQLCAGAFACLTFLLPSMTFAVTTFRLDRPPEITQALNDLSWIYLVAPWQPFLPQNFAFAYAIFLDDRPNPLFPYWLGWVNIIATILFMPASGLHMVRTGPMAWNGAVSFWLAGASFAIQYILNTIYLWRAFERRSYEHMSEE